MSNLLATIEFLNSTQASKLLYSHPWESDEAFKDRILRTFPMMKRAKIIGIRDSSDTREDLFLPPFQPGLES